MIATFDQRELIKGTGIHNNTLQTRLPVDTRPVAEGSTATSSTHASHRASKAYLRYGVIAPDECIPEASRTFKSVSLKNTMFFLKHDLSQNADVESVTTTAKSDAATIGTTKDATIIPFPKDATAHCAPFCAPRCFFITNSHRSLS